MMMVRTIMRGWVRRIVVVVVVVAGAVGERVGSQL